VLSLSVLVCFIFQVLMCLRLLNSESFCRIYIERGLFCAAALSFSVSYHIMSHLLMLFEVLYLSVTVTVYISVTSVMKYSFCNEKQYCSVCFGSWCVLVATVGPI
jgi:hypothetical protein